MDQGIRNKIYKNRNGYNNLTVIIAGMAKIFNNLFGNKEKTTLGRNSANRSTNNDEIKTWINNIIKSCVYVCKNEIPMIYFSIGGSNRFAMYIPYTTKAILLPINIEIIKLVGFSVNWETILVVMFPGSLSKNIFNLLADTNAISIPEKNADRTSVIIIIKYVIVIK